MPALDELVKCVAVYRSPSKAHPRYTRKDLVVEHGIDLALQLVYPDLFGPEEHVEQARRDVDDWLSSGVGLKCFLDSDFPQRLAFIRECPLVIAFEGNLVPDETGVCIVGTRSASEWGRRFSYNLARFCASIGVPVISGLAAGIDTAAHEGCLNGGGRTVAVMGTEISRTYPVENTELRKRIVNGGGLVFSQFLPGQVTSKRSFLERNVTMSGYGILSVIVEATEFSGTRHQADRALKHGRHLILTSRVVEQTKWAQMILQDHPQTVTVVENVAQAYSSVETVLTSWNAYMADLP